MKPIRRFSALALAMVAFQPFVSAAVASAADAPSSWAGLVLVRPAQIVDESGTGSPPLPAGQDGDGFPDTDETVDLSVVVSNKSGQNLTGLTVRLWTTDPRVACISNPVLVVGSIAAGANVVSPTPFRLRVAATADRGGTAPAVACNAGSCSNGAGKCTNAGQCARTAVEAYAARFVATVNADQIQAIGEADSFEVELDLNSTTLVKTTSTLTENFEGGFTNMVLMNLDANIANNTLSDGKRCSYHDPDSPRSITYGDTDCYLGFGGVGVNRNDWHTHDTSESDGGRAFAGARSLHFGVHAGQPGIDTYDLSKMEAIRTKAAIHLAARICRDDPASDKRACSTAADCAVVGGGPCVAAVPELSFKQQISLVDDRVFTIINETVDRAIVAVRTTTGTTWRKVYPYENGYDRKATTATNRCTFDPDDDGNNEDDYFQPGDPNRLLGPSSTCSPEFAFASLGDTDEPFGSANVGRATDGPGLQGSLGVGTWVTSKFDLSAFRGRSITIRWLVSSWKFGEIQSWQSGLQFNPIAYDNGWYVDDVRVTQTLGTSAPTVALDSADRSSLPDCAGACSSVNASLITTPYPSPGPGYPLTVSAASSAADSCPGGQLSYEFWIDGNANGTLGEAQDWVFAGPALSSEGIQAPLALSAYGVRVRCASSPSCADDATLSVPVECPAPATYDPYAWWANLQMTRNAAQTRSAGQIGDAVRGLLLTLRTTATFGAETCLRNDGDLTNVQNQSPENPPLGDGYYYLMRGTEPTCAESPTYRTFSPAENPGDPAKRDDEITTCPALDGSRVETFVRRAATARSARLSGGARGRGADVRAGRVRRGVGRLKEDR